MTRRIATSDDHVLRLDSGWHMAVTAADAVADLSGLSRITDWIAAPVPGTVAGALADAGRFSAESPYPLHDKDAWYVTKVDVAEPGERQLVLEGLATIAEVYWNGGKVLDCDSMYQRHEVPVAAKAENTLAICFRALAPHLEGKGPRARWKTKLAISPGLRLKRTTLLGHMPGWCPEVHAVGPWRPVSLVRPDGFGLVVERLKATLDEDGNGFLTVLFRVETQKGTPVLSCAGVVAKAERRADGGWAAELRIAGVAPWWPHTHG
ncbi:MAG: glycoside hydrolase family 2 protein, partial [Oricola sp.]